jgi:hypothetical protein
MYNYGRTQSPKIPGPEISVEVFPPDGSERRKVVTCLIDTAATVSVLPLSLIEELYLREYTSSGVTWGSGARTQEPKYHVSLRISDRVFSDLWVIMCRKEYGLIGRDVLNAHRLTCDGPGEIWKVEPEWV